VGHEGNICYPCIDKVARLKREEEDGTFDYRNWIE
jgi:hypothetical protein